VRALRLPERLGAASTVHYAIGDPSPGDGAKLRGVLCSTVRDAQHAAAGRWDFLVMRGELATKELQIVCASVSLPVFATGVQLEAAWMLGASGISLLDP
jgi:hypothetical protein